MPSTTPESLQAIIRQQAGYRCGYCLSHQQYVPLKLEIEHIVPRSKGGTDDEINLWLACRSCNLHKSNQLNVLDPETGERVTVFNPRAQTWQEHFQWGDDGTKVVGCTACGRATVIALNLNNLVAINCPSQLDQRRLAPTPRRIGP